MISDLLASRFLSNHSVFSLHNDVTFDWEYCIMYVCMYINICMIHNTLYMENHVLRELAQRKQHISQHMHIHPHTKYSGL